MGRRQDVEPLGKLLVKWQPIRIAGIVGEDQDRVAGAPAPEMEPLAGYRDKRVSPCRRYRLSHRASPS
jgi:hypothetical protein